MSLDAQEIKRCGSRRTEGRSIRRRAGSIAAAGPGRNREGDRRRRSAGACGERRREIAHEDVRPRHGTARYRPSSAGPSPSAPAAKVPPRKPSTPANSAGRQQKIEERVAAATEELASGITEAASAAEELRRAMEQIASGAEEAASASQEDPRGRCHDHARRSLQARDRAESARRRTEALQGLLAETSNQIGAWASNIKHNGERQAGSVAIIEQLSQQAASIGEVTKTVGQVSDQTNLLALNAAIEAARAGDHGRGFAVVADEVRALAETSEKSARDAQDLAEQIQEQVKSVAAMIKAAADGAAAEAEKSQTVILALGELAQGSWRADRGQPIDRRVAAQEAEAAAREAQKGAEIISSAAEEQAAAAAEALRSVEQQTIGARRKPERHAIACRDGERSWQRCRKATARADQLASAAEQLSTAVQEISGAANADHDRGRADQPRRAAAGRGDAGSQRRDRSDREDGAGGAGRTPATSLDRTRRIAAMLAEIRSTIDRACRPAWRGRWKRHARAWS